MGTQTQGQNDGVLFEAETLETLTVDLTIDRDGNQIQVTVTLTGTLDATQSQNNNQQTLPNQGEQNSDKK